MKRKALQKLLSLQPTPANRNIRTIGSINTVVSRRASRKTKPDAYFLDTNVLMYAAGGPHSSFVSPAAPHWKPR